MPQLEKSQFLIRFFTYIYSILDALFTKKFILI